MDIHTHSVLRLAYVPHTPYLVTPCLPGGNEPMKRTAKVMTAHTVESAQPKDARYEVPDASFPGFYLIVQPSGAKSFALRFRIHGKAKKLTIGSATKLSLSEARRIKLG